MLKRLLFLTGEPSVGKTTVLLRVVDLLKAKGYSVGGMLSREVRSCGTRVGFEIVDLNTGWCGWLAHVNQKNGPRVGKYHVNMEHLDTVGVNAILNAVKSLDVIAIDEIGPMELFSQRFKKAVKAAIESDKFVAGVVHSRARDKLIDYVKERENAEIIRVTYENRSRLHETMIRKAVDFLKTRK